MGNQPPLNFFSQNQGGLTGVQPPPPIQNSGGVETPPTPPVWRPWI